MTITSADITAQVTASLAGLAEDEFDIPAIVAEIIQTYGRVDIDDIDTAEYWALVEAHEA